MSIPTKEQITQDLKIALAGRGTPEEVQAFFDGYYASMAIDSEYE